VFPHIHNFFGPTQPPVQWVLGVKWPGFEADYTPPYSVEVKNEWHCTSTPQIHLHGVVLRPGATLPLSKYGNKLKQVKL